MIQVLVIGDGLAGNSIEIIKEHLVRQGITEKIEIINNVDNIINTNAEIKMDEVSMISEKEIICERNTKKDKKVWKKNFFFD